MCSVLEAYLVPKIHYLGTGVLMLEIKTIHLYMIYSHKAISCTGFQIIFLKKCLRVKKKKSEAI